MPCPPPDPESADERHPCLIVVAGIGIGRSFVLKERMRVGRDPECEIVLPHGTVSWRHLTVSYLDGIVVAEDLGSRNGTFVGLEKVKRRKLVDGDVLAVGDHVLLKLVFVDRSKATEKHSHLLPPEPMTGVQDAGSLLARLQMERDSVVSDDRPLTLVWCRVDGLGDQEELGPVEKAMRVVASAILQATQGEILLARSAEGDLVGMGRVSTVELHEMVGEACRRVRGGVDDGSSPWPLRLVAAVIPISESAPADPELTLRLARERAYDALADTSGGVVTTAPLGAE